MNNLKQIIKLKSSNCNQLLDAVEMAWSLAVEQQRKYQIVRIGTNILALPKGSLYDNDSDDAWSSGILMEITP